MKKSLLACCGAAFAALAFAQEPAVTADAQDAQKPVVAKAAARTRAPRMMPTMLLINETTTAEQLAKYKEEVNKKIDEAFKTFQDQKVEEGQKKNPVRVMLNVMDRPFSARPRTQGARPDRPPRPPRKPAAAEEK